MGESGLGSSEAQSWTRGWCSEEKCRLKTQLWGTLHEGVVRTPGEEEIRHHCEKNSKEEPQVGGAQKSGRR